MVRQTVTPTIKSLTIPLETRQKREKESKVRPVFPTCETCGRTNHSTEICHLEQTQRLPPRIRRPEGQNAVQQRSAQGNSDGKVQAAAQTLNQKRPVFTPELQLTDRRQLKNKNIHQFPRLSGSKARRHLQVNVT